MAKTVSPGVQALRKVVEDVYADARKAKAEGKLVGWSSSKFPCELAEAFDLNVMYPENQAAGIAANRDGEIMCKAAEDLGFDNDICGYARISLAYAAGKRASRKVDLETGGVCHRPQQRQAPEGRERQGGHRPRDRQAQEGPQDHAALHRAGRHL